MLGDKQEVMFGGVMSAQNTHHILAFYHIFDSFQLVISVFIVLYLILGFLCILGEKERHLGPIRDLKKKIGEPSLNVATFQRRNVLTSSHLNVATLRSYDVHPFISPILRRRLDLVNMNFK